MIQVTWILSETDIVNYSGRSHVTSSIDTESGYPYENMGHDVQLVLRL